MVVCSDNVAEVCIIYTIDGKLFVNNCLLLWNPLIEGHMCCNISGTQVNDWRCAVQNSLINHSFVFGLVCVLFSFPHSFISPTSALKSVQFLKCP